MIRLAFFILPIILFVSCKKPQDRRCAKSTGEDTTIVVETGTFDKLYLREHIEYVLVQDTVEKVVITGGKNIVNFIKAEVADGTLEMYNDNKCNFLRTHKRKAVAEIHYKDIINILFEGTEKMTSKGTLNFGWLVMVIRDGAGPVDLDLNGNVIYTTVSHGWGDFTFRGNVGYANLNVRSNGYCDTYGLNVSDSLTVISNTPALVKVNANNAKFKVELDAAGDIWYKGVPNGTPKVYKYGSGELIDMN